MAEIGQTTDPVELLRLSLPYLEEAAQEDVGYGFFPGGDPRTFSPDPECSSPEEQAQWKADCEVWARGDGKPNPPGDEWIRDENGQLAAHIQHSGYGLGTYTFQDRAAAELVTQVRTVLVAASVDVGGKIGDA